MTSIVPAAIVTALSVLNSHARAYGCGRDAIYAYKSFAALLGADRGQAAVRPVATMAKCHFCDGTGCFISYYGGRTGERCRKCGRTGYVHLRFAETTIGEHVWHHPWERDGNEIFKASAGWASVEYVPSVRSLWIRSEGREPRQVGFESLDGWAPNRPGEKLSGERAAELLNLVEDWLLSIDGVGDPLRWPLDRAQRQVKAYNLCLGWLGIRCHYCGSDGIASGQGHIQKPFHWTVRCCRRCAEQPVDQWDKTLPQTALTPHVARWAARRAELAKGIAA